MRVSTIRTSRFLWRGFIYKLYYNEHTQCRQIRTTVRLMVTGCSRESTMNRTHCLRKRNRSKSMRSFESNLYQWAHQECQWYRTVPCRSIQYWWKSWIMWNAKQIHTVSHQHTSRCYDSKQISTSLIGCGTDPTPQSLPVWGWFFLYQIFWFLL